MEISRSKCEILLLIAVALFFYRGMSPLMDGSSILINTGKAESKIKAVFVPEKDSFNLSLRGRLNISRNTSVASARKKWTSNSTSPADLRSPRDLISKQLVDFNGSPVDFVIAIKYVYQATLLMVRTINLYHSPRFIWFIATEAMSCSVLTKFSTNVKCIVETEVFHGQWSVPALAKKISVKNRAGWFFLQQLNFQVALSIKELSDHYIVWDADTIPTSKQLHFFDYVSRKTIYYLNDENIKAPEAMAYHNSYELLTGLRIDHPRSRNYVSHFMCFSKEYAKAIIHHIAAWRGVAIDQWMVAVTQTIDDPFLGRAGRENGFADYDLYGSWVSTFHGNRIILKTEWWKTRHQRIDKSSQYKIGDCVPKEAVYRSWVDKYDTVTLELHKGDASCKEMPYQHALSNYPNDEPKWLSEDTFQRNAESVTLYPRNRDTEINNVFLSRKAHSPACAIQWRERGGLFRTGVQLHGPLARGGADDPAWVKAVTVNKNTNGAWYRKPSMSNTALYVVFGGSEGYAINLRVAFGAMIKSARHPSFGDFDGPIVVVSTHANEIMSYLADKDTQEWVGCLSYETTKRALENLPTEYGSKVENPCAVSFMQYTKSWIATAQDYRRMKMAVHEVIDIENSRRAKSKPEFSLPAIEHILYVDVDMTIASSIANHLEFTSETYTGQDYTLFEQPIDNKHKDGWYHGGLWHTHINFGRNFSRFWLRQYDIRNVLAKSRRELDQWPLNEAIDIYSNGKYFPLKKEVKADSAIDVNILSFSSPKNTYPLVPGEHPEIDKKGVFLHWSGINVPNYARHMKPAYERIRKKLGAPPFMPKGVGGKSFNGWKKEKLNFHIEPLELLSMENVHSNLRDANGDHILVILERPEKNKMEKLFFSILRHLQPLYIVVLVDAKDDCTTVVDAAYRADEQLCELSIDETPLEPSRSYGYGGRNAASVASRAVLCENDWTKNKCTFDVLKAASHPYDKLSKSVLFWDSNFVPLGDIKDLLFKNGKTAFVTSHSAIGDNPCRRHAPWLLLEPGSAFATPCKPGNWRPAFEASNGCKSNGGMTGSENQVKGEGHYWKKV